MNLQGRITWTIVAGALLTVAAPTPARADDDLSASIFTDNGFELRRDDRILAFFAALNAVGYDRAEVTRTLPFPRSAFHPLRTRIRQAIAGSTAKARPGIDRMLDTHPVALGVYVGAVLTLSPQEPFSSTGETPEDFESLGRTLADFAATTHLAKVIQSVGPAYRDTFKQLRSVVDGPFGALRQTYRLNEENAPTLILVPNPLDAPDAAYAGKTADGNHIVVFGLPADEKKLDLKPALRAYSALLAQEATAGAHIDGLSHAVEALHARGLATDITPATLLRESLKAAVEAKLWSDNADAAAEAAFQKGLLFAPDLLKALNAPADAYPADKGSFAVQAASGTDIDQALARLGGGAASHD